MADYYVPADIYNAIQARRAKGLYDTIVWGMVVNTMYSDRGQQADALMLAAVPFRERGRIIPSVYVWGEGPDVP